MQVLTRRIIGSFILFLFAFTVPSALEAATVIDSTETKLIKSEHGGMLLESPACEIVVLSGGPYEMGFQHGSLLRDEVRATAMGVLEMVRDALQRGDSGLPESALLDAWKRTRPFVSERYLEEMRGLADGAGLDVNDVELANVMPELFHCSGFSVFAPATAKHKLLHGRILDYMTHTNLQSVAKVMVYRPEGFNEFVSVGYSGFIGCVTGMNNQQVAIGEIGGGGVGDCDGEPMCYLLRRALEETDSLEQAVRHFETANRTCHYYYVISDAKIPDARGLECKKDSFEVLAPNVPHDRLPYASPGTLLMSEGERYGFLIDMVKEVYPKITLDDALDFMDRPVAMKSCLHRVLMAPATNEIWIANAKEPRGKKYAACYQPYYYMKLSKFFNEPNN